MKLIKTILMSMIIVNGLCVTTVYPQTDSCLCAQITYQPDCLLASVTVNGTILQCKWTSSTNATTNGPTEGRCSSATRRLLQVQPQNTYCSQLSINDCAKTNGCATLDNINCTPFTGCTAYIGTSNTACQAISNQCTTNGTYCISKASCSTYSFSQCAINPSNSGSGQCKWIGQACVDYLCSDMFTQVQCLKYNQGCVWDGANCYRLLTPCSHIPGTSKTCQSEIALDGPCKFVSGSTCSQVTCSDAPTTLNTNQACQLFLPSCLFTTGKGCVSELQPCSSYLNQTTCYEMIGSDGPCKQSISRCAQKLCTDILYPQASDSVCQAFSNQCYFNGIRCLSRLPSCTEYTNGFATDCSDWRGCARTDGVIANCYGYIGWEGPCGFAKQGSVGISCIARTCQLFFVKIGPQNLNSYCKSWHPLCLSNGTECYQPPESCETTVACKQFELGCFFNGVKCVSSLPSCTSYVNGIDCYAGPCPASDGIVANCQAYIGWEGNCRLNLDGMIGRMCMPRVCQADLRRGPTLNTAYCQSYVQACQFNGDNCYLPSDYCQSTLQCKKFHLGCYFDGAQCWSSLHACAGYGAYWDGVPCNQRIGSDGRCYSPCEDCNCARACFQGIGGASNTNAYCKQFEFQSTCVTNGVGCYVPTDSCEDTQYQISCQGQSKCSQIGLCYDNTSCSNYVTKSACIWNTAGYLYQRASIWNVSVCISQHQCNDFSGGYFTDALCNAALNGCVTSGHPHGACIEPNCGCSCFWGTNLPGNLCLQVMNGICTGQNGSVLQCIPKTCQNYSNYTPNLSTDSICNGYLKGCVSDGNLLLCTNRTTCSGYHGTAASCMAITSNTDVGPIGQIPCWPSSPNQTSQACRIMTCSDIIIGQAPYAAVENNDCQSKNPNCTSSYNSGVGKQCVDVINCASFQGNDSFCRQFIVNGQQCFQPSTNTNSNTQCVALACTLNATATSDMQCEEFWPSPSGSILNSNCQWNGVLGCVKGQTLKCSNFFGNNATCPQFTTAIDAPCKGNQLFKYGQNNCVATECSDAPSSYTTNEKCNSFRKGCMTTGNGCQSTSQMNSCQQFQSQSLCSQSKLGPNGSQTCSWNQLCLTKMDACSQVNALQSYGPQQQNLCINMTVEQTTQNPLGTCSWYSGSCRNTQCDDLPKNLTTDQSCSQLIPICTSNGSGCTIKGACNTYLDKQTCLLAITTDPISCSWITNVGCRMAKCSDNKFSSDTSCYFSGLNCRTNGETCVDASKLLCSHFTNINYCLQDGNNNPCLWINNKCYQYSGCDSIPWTTHAQCQMILTGSASSQCTSDGTICQPLNTCVNYKSNRTSCVISNDRQPCQFSDKLNLCQGTCSLVKSASNSVCQSYGSTCISNGSSCQDQSTCSSYTQIACSNMGTDGQCIWSSNICRTQQCSDGLLNTYSACSAFPAPFINMCTTNGTTCILKSLCSSYVLQASCLEGTDGTCSWSSGSCGVKKVLISSCSTYNQADCSNIGTDGTCIWSTETNTCRTQKCSDAIINNTSDAGCAQFPGPNINMCTTNGIGCIPRGSCTSYLNQAGCLQGFDGIGNHIPCIWIASTNTCRVVQCGDATSNNTTDQGCAAFLGPQINICTTNGKSCIPRSICSSYNQSSCFQGTDGACYWSSVLGTCSNKQQIILLNCSQYSQAACGNQGSDGQCIFGANGCRTQQCSDAVTNNTTDSGCSAFSGPYVNLCATDGLGCIPRQMCSSYTHEVSCVSGLDGDCFWVASLKSCRLKQCTDYLLITNSACMALQIASMPRVVNGITIKYLSCVSNGTNCIPQANCSQYTNPISCSGFNTGMDGTCGFIPSLQQNQGTCKTISYCTDIGTDAITCQQFSDRCQFKPISLNNIASSLCQPKDCAQNTQTCRPIPSFNYNTYTICAPVSLTNSTCQVTDGSQLTESTCYSSSLKTYTWNQQEKTCIYCGSNQNLNNTINATNSTNQAFIIHSSIILGILLI